MKNILFLGILFIFLLPVLTKADPMNGSIRVTLQTSTISLDPGGIQDSQSWMVSRQVNCQLVRSEGATFVLDAAESIKYISPLKIVLKISNNAKFHDGTPLAAEDVLASLNYIKSSRNILGNLFTWLKAVDVIDNKTILFILKRPVPQFLKVLSSTNFTIFKKSFLQMAAKNSNLWKKPLGCGGYKVVEFTNRYIKLVPVSHGLPIAFYMNETNQINANDLKKYDIVTLNVTGNSNELDNFNTIEMFDPIQFYLGLNTKSMMWKSKYDRCKFLSKLNTKKLVENYGKQAIEATDLIPKGTLGYNKNVNFNERSAHIATHAESKTPSIKFKPFCVSYLTVSFQEKNIIEYLNTFRKIYPKVEIRPIHNVKRFGKEFIHANCDAILFGWKSNYFDGYEYLTMFESGDANFSNLNNKKISNEIEKSQDIITAKERAAEYQKIINEIGDLCIVRPMFTLPKKKFYVRKNLKTPGIGLVSIFQYYLGNITR